MTNATISRIENTYGEYVALVYGHYGATLSVKRAGFLAREHGFLLSELQAEGLKISGDTVKTLAVFDALGY